MILKIRRKMTHADSCRCVPTFLIIDNITSANFGEVDVEVTNKNVTLISDNGGTSELGSLPYSISDIVWEDENQIGSSRFCRAVLNISRTAGVAENVVYFFNTEAFLMNDHGETIERLCP